MTNNSNNAQIMYNGFCPYTIQNIYYFSLSNYKYATKKHIYFYYFHIDPKF